MSKDQYPNLFSPKSIGAVELKNSIVTAPMTRVSAQQNGTPTDQMLDYYTAYAKGGYGLVITEGTYMDELHSQGYKNQPGITRAEHVDAWKKIVESVHGAGAKMFNQLMHAGALSQHNEYVNVPLGPSAIQPEGEMAKNYYGDGPFKTPKEATHEDLEQAAIAFGESARRSVEAGFDGVEIHGANGYLIDNFNNLKLNQRKDEYGGPVENRIRFACEVVQAVKAAVGKKVPVGIRISQIKVNDFTYQWPGGVDDAEVIFTSLRDAGADYVHVNSPPEPREVFGSGKPLAGLAKRYYRRTVIACGGLADPAVGEKLLADGDADLVAMARASLADPEWPSKVAEGKEPIPFDPGMTQPLATLDNTAEWKRANL